MTEAIQEQIDSLTPEGKVSHLDNLLIDIWLTMTKGIEEAEPWNDITASRAAFVLGNFHRLGLKDVATFFKIYTHRLRELRGILVAAKKKWDESRDENAVKPGDDDFVDGETNRELYITALVNLERWQRRLDREWDLSHPVALTDLYATDAARNEYVGQDSLTSMLAELPGFKFSREDSEAVLALATEEE